MRPYSWNYDKVLLVGSSGSGKTELAIKQYLPHAERLLIIDTNAEISSKTGLAKTRNLSEWSPEKCPCYFPQKYTIAHLEKMIQKARSFTNITLFIDDLDTFSGGQYYSGSEIISLMINARHQNIGIILTLKAPNNLDKRIIQNCHYVHLWNVNSRYSDVLYEWSMSLGSDAETMKKQMNLEVHTFGYYAPIQDNINATDPKQLIGFFRL